MTSGATNALIDNAGRIMGVAEEGIDAVSATGVTIVNSGSISGGEAGVQMGSESDLRNSGTISTVLVTGEDTGVFNDGTMGRVSLRGEGVNADDNALVNMGSIGSASGIAVIFNDGAVRIGNHGDDQRGERRYQRHRRRWRVDQHPQYRRHHGRER